MNSELLVRYMLQMLNLPYIWGGDDPMKGFDCSGLACEILIARNKLPHKTDMTAQMLYNTFRKPDFPLDCMPIPGDLCFYGKSDKEIIHVATFIDIGTVIEAGGGGSSTVSLEMAAKQNAYIRLRPFNYRRDVVGIVPV